MNAIRDQHGRVIAIYETQGTRTVVKTPNGQTKASYDTRDNITRRANGSFCSYGNTLSQMGV